MYSKDDAGNERAIALGVATQAETDAGVVVKAITADLNRIALSTPVATTSGTEHDFTGIPAGVRRVIVTLSGISTSGTSIMQLQLGTAGGIEVTSYAAASFDSGGQAGSTAGFVFNRASVAAGTYSGQVVFNLHNSTSNLWAASGVFVRTDIADGSSFAGTKTISSVLNRIRLTTANGSDTFDAGSVNIAYER